MVKRKKKENLINKLSPGGFHVKLDHLGETYEADGATLFQAISAIPLDWIKVKSKGTITVSKDSKIYSHFFMLKQLRRMFANKLLRNAFAKNLEYLFKDRK